MTRRWTQRSHRAAQEILILDIADLELPGKTGPGDQQGRQELVFWQTGTAQLLPRLLARGDQGPVVLTSRRACQAAVGGDLDAGPAGAHLDISVDGVTFCIS